jgi:hypothetical protein
LSGILAKGGKSMLPEFVSIAQHLGTVGLQKLLIRCPTRHIELKNPGELYSQATIHYNSRQTRLQGG